MKTSGTEKLYGSDMVASALLERILKGEWKVGERIPSIDQLETMLPVSRVTISKGIHKLSRQGYLHRAWRSGTYVSSNVLVRRILLHVGGDVGLLQNCPFGMVVTRKLEALLTAADMQTEIHWEARQSLAGSRLAADLLDDHFDGVISVQSNLPAQIEAYLPALLGKLPMVHVGVHHQVPWVFVDMAAFKRHALAHCRRTASRRVLYFCPPDEPLQQIGEAAPEIEAHTLLAEDGEWPMMVTENDAYSLFLNAWSRLDGKLDAVVAADDIQAKGIVQAVLSLGAQVSDRLQIIALTNKDSGIFYPLAVEAIEIDTDEVTRQALRLLEEQLLHGARMQETGHWIAPEPIGSVHTAFTKA